VTNSSSPAPLAGLTVVDLSGSIAGAYATQFLADSGADVLLVEPPEGSPLRSRPGWPAFGRGKRSTVLDLRVAADRGRLDELLARADVLVTTFRPKNNEKYGLTAERLAELNPRLVTAAITGWGSSGPWRDLKGYEGLVMAKVGYQHAKKMLSLRPGPSYSSAPFAAWGAAQTAIHGILAALIHRSRTGLGQYVEADLVRGVGTIDTWQWTCDIIATRWPDAYPTADAFTPEGELLGHLVYALLIAPTKDGAWLQFAQTDARLFKAMMEEFGLTSIFTDPKWAGAPILPTQELRTELWETMIRKCGERTLAEWQQVFETNPFVSAETFRFGPDVLDHPQQVHEGRSVVFDDPQLGPVRQPATLVLVGGRAITPPRAAPQLGADPGELADPIGIAEAAGDRSAEVPTLPLAGTTILDFGVMFAGPHGATLLTDLGARVIKVETLAGDSIRGILPFPESGGAKVMAGKDSICLDLTTDEGKQIVYRLVEKADVFMQAFRAGAAARAGIDADTLYKINPDLLYVNAPGYGVDGPYGARPAYAPSISSSAGVALAEVPDALTSGTDIDSLKRTAARLNTASAIPTLQPDGMSALGVATTILLGLVAKEWNRVSGQYTATMLGTTTQAMMDWVVDYAGKPSVAMVDPDSWGLGALYRIYPAGEGHVFLAAPKESEWGDLVAALDHDERLTDPRFATADARAANDESLADALTVIFGSKPAAEWEAQLTKADVGCVQVHEDSPTRHLMVEPELAGYVGTVTSAIFEEHTRPSATVTFSRSSTELHGFDVAGAQTDAILGELGYTADQIADLHARNIVAG
jgi:crotonobetainyl-CoA:carnitine CoA-transferase CaiB-like acyl-CoA transferase